MFYDHDSRTKRIEPMRGSAISFILYSGARGALPLMAHPQRSAKAIA
jgi:hypothetical protein